MEFTPIEDLKTEVESMASAFFKSLPNLTIALAILVVTLIAGRVVRAIVSAAMTRAHVRDALITLARNLISIAAWIVGVAIAMTVIFPSVSPSDIIAGLDARGFILASGLAYKLGCGLVLIRKQGKLPCATYSQHYQLEYGEATMEVHQDAFKTHKKVLLVDDLLATGGTAKAGAQLIEKAGGEVMAITCIIELVSLKGREHLRGYSVDALIQVD